VFLGGNAPLNTSNTGLIVLPPLLKWGRGDLKELKRILTWLQITLACQDFLECMGKQPMRNKLNVLKIIVPVLLMTLTFEPEATSQMIDDSVAIEDAKLQWIEQTAASMASMRPEMCTNVIEPSIRKLGDYYRLSYRLKGSGCIRFDNGDWIFLVSNSEHFDKEVGDVTLAIDNSKRIFINDGHVCGGIVNFIVDGKTALDSAEAFFQHTVSDTDDIKWQPCDEALCGAY